MEEWLYVQLLYAVILVPVPVDFGVENDIIMKFLIANS